MTKEKFCADDKSFTARCVMVDEQHFSQGEGNSFDSQEAGKQQRDHAPGALFKFNVLHASESPTKAKKNLDQFVAQVGRLKLHLLWR